MHKSCLVTPQVHLVPYTSSIIVLARTKAVLFMCRGLQLVPHPPGPGLFICATDILQCRRATPQGQLVRDCGCYHGQPCLPHARSRCSIDRSTGSTTCKEGGEMRHGQHDIAPWRAPSGNSAALPCCHATKVPSSHKEQRHQKVLC